MVHGVESGRSAGCTRIKGKSQVEGEGGGYLAVNETTVQGEGGGGGYLDVDDKEFRVRGFTSANISTDIGGGEEATAYLDVGLGDNTNDDDPDPDGDGKAGTTHPVPCCPPSTHPNLPRVD